MGKTESTAVNQLIANLQGRPLEKDEGRDDLGFDERTMPAREPAATRPSSPAPVRTTAMQPAVAPPPMPRRRSASGTEAPGATTGRTTIPPPVRTTTSSPAVPPPVPSTPRATLPPPNGRSSAPRVEAQGTPAPEIKRPSEPPARASQPPAPDAAPAWLAQPVTSPAPAAAAGLPPRDLTAPAAMVDGRNWFLESSQAVPSVEEHEIGTQSVPKRKALPMGFLVGTAVVCALGGVFVGGYLTFNGSAGGKGKSTQVAAAIADRAAAPLAAAPVAPAPAAAEPAAPAAGEPAAPAVAEPAAPAAAEPAAAPVAAEPAAAPVAAALGAAPAAAAPAVAAPAVAAPAAAAPATAAIAAEPAALAPPPAAAAPAAGDASLVDVLFLSSPPGASVVLVDDGKTIPIGTTPVSASVDAAHAYEAVFALEGQKTRIVQLDPRHDRQFSVDLRSGKTKIKHSTDAAVAAAPAVAPVETPAAKPARTRPEPKKDRPKRVAAAEPVPPAAKPAVASGDGVLMVSAKPPCEIYVDGKSTGLTTPQRAISLSAGTHKITLVNKDASLRKTIAVKVTAGKPTKLIQDYTSEIK